MQWLLDNWIIVLLGVGMIGMHMFGHGGHGGHGGGQGGGKHKHSDPDATTDVVDQALPQNQQD